MKYLYFLVLCGTLALEANGVRLRVFLRESVGNSFREQIDSSGSLGQSRRRFSNLDHRGHTGGRQKPKKYESVEEQELEVKEDTPDSQTIKDDKGDKVDKMNIQDMFLDFFQEIDEEPDQNPKQSKVEEYDESVDKILNAAKKILTKGDNLFYNNDKKFGCGKGIALKCQYTSNETENAGFYGYQAKPKMIMVHTTDVIVEFLSNPIVTTCVDMLDQAIKAEAAAEPATRKLTTMEEDDEDGTLGDILMGIRTIFERDPEEPKKFVCGLQVDDNYECGYYDNNALMGLRCGTTGTNRDLKSLVTSKEFKRGVINFAKAGGDIFPTLKEDARAQSFSKALNGF